MFASVLDHMLSLCPFLLNNQDMSILCLVGVSLCPWCLECSQCCAVLDSSVPPQSNLCPPYVFWGQFWQLKPKLCMYRLFEGPLWEFAMFHVLWERPPVDRQKRAGCGILFWAKQLIPSVTISNGILNINLFSLTEKVLLCMHLFITCCFCLHFGFGLFRMVHF